MAGNEEFIPGIQSLQKALVGYPAGLSIHTTVAVPTRKDEVPDSIQWNSHLCLEQHTWEEVIHISQKRR